MQACRSLSSTVAAAARALRAQALATACVRGSHWQRSRSLRRDVARTSAGKQHNSFIFPFVDSRNSSVISERVCSLARYAASKTCSEITAEIRNFSRVCLRQKPHPGLPQRVTRCPQRSCQKLSHLCMSLRWKNTRISRTTVAFHQGAAQKTLSCVAMHPLRDQGDSSGRWGLQTHVLHRDRSGQRPLCPAAAISWS
jgi:hypothetical protein